MNKTEYKYSMAYLLYEHYCYESSLLFIFLDKSKAEAKLKELKEMDVLYEHIYRLIEMEIS